MVSRGGKRKIETIVNPDETNDSDDDLDDADRELLSLMPKRVRDSENIINIAQSTSELSREQICSLFIEIVKRPDQNYEFDLAFWLQRYQSLSVVPNFSESALVLVCAGQIYCRKIDFLHDFILKIHTQTGKAVDLCENAKREAAAIEQALANNQPVPKKKRIVKKKRMNKKDEYNDSFDDIFGGDMTPLEVVVSKEPLQETVVLQYKEKRDDSIKFFNSCQRLKRKLMILKIMKQARRKMRSKKPIFSCEFAVQSDNHEILNYANDELVDLDDEIVAGTRRDYFVFMGMINRNTHTLNLTHNFNEESECDKGNAAPCTGATLLPPEYVERIYNVKLRNPNNYYAELRKEIEIWKNLGPERNDERNKRCILIAYQKAVKLFDDQNVIEHLRTSNVITESQYSEAIQRLTDENSSAERTQDCMRYLETSLPLVEKQTENLSQDSGVGSSINDSQIPDGTLHLSATSNFNQPNISHIECMDEVFNSTPNNSIDQMLTINSTMRETIVRPLNTSKISPPSIVEKLATAQLRISVDEGISCSASGTCSPLPRFSDLDPTTRMMLSPKVQLMDICDPIPNDERMGLKIVLKETFEAEVNRFYIENKLLHAQWFSNYTPPIEIISSQVPIELNFLSLPEKLLRRKCKFALPNEFRGMKIRKTNELLNLSSNECRSPVSDDEDFYGFADSEININLLEKQNTPQEISQFSGIGNENGQPNIINSRSFSQDSGIAVCNSPPHNTEPDESPVINQTELIASNNASTNSKGLMFDNYETDDNIVDKITEWYSHLAPILKASKERSFFDIHAYGKDIIDTFSAEKTTGDDCPNTCGEVISFDELMSKKKKDCTARYFLSMLQLANNGNVEIIPPANRSPTKLVETSELKLRLLSRTMRSEAMDDEQKFDNYEPSSKKHKVLNNKAARVVNPVQKIIKTCNSSLQGKRKLGAPESEKIRQMIELYKNSPNFSRTNSQNFTSDQVLSIANSFHSHKNLPSSSNSTFKSEFCDSGFQSVSNISLKIGDG